MYPCGNLLGKGWPLGSLTFDVILWFCHFQIWCPGSGVVLDCINSWSLPSSLILVFEIIISLSLVSRQLLTKVCILYKNLLTFYILNNGKQLTAPIAQLVERPLSEQKVVGWNPGRTIYQRCKKWYLQLPCWCLHKRGCARKSKAGMYLLKRYCYVAIKALQSLCCSFQISDIK